MKRQLTRVFCVIIAALTLLSSPAGAVTRCPELDAALVMLEEGNPILEAYNAQTGAGLSPVAPNGCPYFFGGKDATLVGRTQKAWESSTYYKEGQWYPGGLDCVGFTRYVFSASGHSEHPAISAMVGERGRPYQVPMSEGQPAALLSEVLRTGDLLALRHASGGYHVLMYIGTLRSFGFTEDTVGTKLADKLDYPLLIHCSSNRDYSERYTYWIRENARWANTTDGGVMVSVFGCSEEGCDGVMNNLDRSSFSYFNLKGYHLTVYTLEEGDQSRWIRWK